MQQDTRTIITELSILYRLIHTYTLSSIITRTLNKTNIRCLNPFF